MKRKCPCPGVANGAECICAHSEAEYKPGNSAPARKKQCLKEKCSALEEKLAKAEEVAQKELKKRQELMTCPICLDLASPLDALVFIKCQHVVCLDCLRHLMGQAVQFVGRIPSQVTVNFLPVLCPTCRDPVRFNLFSGASKVLKIALLKIALPRNFRLRRRLTLFS